MIFAPHHCAQNVKAILLSEAVYLLMSLHGGQNFSTQSYALYNTAKLKAPWSTHQSTALQPANKGDAAPCLGYCAHRRGQRAVVLTIGVKGLLC